MTAGLRASYGLSLDDCLAVPFDELVRLVYGLEGLDEDTLALFQAAIP